MLTAGALHRAVVVAVIISAVPIAAVSVATRATVVYRPAYRVFRGRDGPLSHAAISRELGCRLALRGPVTIPRGRPVGLCRHGWSIGLPDTSVGR